MTPNLDHLGIDEKVELLDLLQEKNRRAQGKKLFSLYPEEGNLSRHAYPKFMEFFAAGAKHKERMAIAANRVGKTYGCGGFEFVLHLTGEYPYWWVGKRFDRPVRAWAAGDTSKTVRDILQEKLLGPHGSFGTGLIPLANLRRVLAKAGVADAVEIIYVQHKSGGNSVVQLKSYDQKREAFQGTEQDLIWLDEEPPLDIYTECLLRTMTTGGILMCTFTPLQGMSETVLAFLPGGSMPEKQEGQRFVIGVGWDDAPHLSEKDKQDLLASIPPYQRDARTKGIPQLGSGAIYPIPESEILIDPIVIPSWWPRGYALDVGWNRTAALWGAHDQETDTLYVYDEYYRAHEEPSVHAAGIRSRGAWMPGIIDPAARGRSQKDGTQLLQSYLDLGLSLTLAKNAVETGIMETWQRLSTGRTKVFRTCQNFISEYRLYRRDDKGKVVKVNDHLMDDLRYMTLSGFHYFQRDPKYLQKSGIVQQRSGHQIEYEPLSKAAAAPSMHQTNFEQDFRK